jgi:APA family basic amino acid/polyamine antiporter
VSKSAKINISTAIALVIANMVGTGVFTSLGFQLLDLKSPFTIILLWLIGGLLALCGALTYGEIGVTFPKSGGEYHYLSKLYHPLFGFLSGWVSITVGFAAPIALAAVALGYYVSNPFPFISSNLLAVCIVILLTLIHSTQLKSGANFQKITTLIKVIIITGFILSGFFHQPIHQTSILPNAESWKEIFSPAFAISLIYVSYAYSGWNASSYIAEEIEDADKNLPKSLLIGTAVVTVLYVLLNFIFMYSVPTTELAGKVDIGFISAEHLFGKVIGNIMGVVIAFLLISSISAMVMTGPRVSKAMGEDFYRLRFLAKTSKNNIPVIALFIQCTISIGLIITSNFESVLTFIGFTLSLFTFFTVAGIFKIRANKKQSKEGYKTFLYPFVPLFYLFLNGWVICFTFYNKPLESIYGLINLLIGFIVWLIVKKDNEQQKFD